MTAKSKKLASKVVPLRRTAPAAPSVAPCLGTVVAWSEAEGLLVDFEGNPRGPRPALSLVALSREEIAEIIATNRAVLLTFDRDDRAILLGVVQPLPSEEPPASRETARGEVEAVVDGEVVQLRGKERIELRCGSASIVLTRAGKIILDGTYISSRSSGAHRIRGGSVEVN